MTAPTLTAFIVDWPLATRAEAEADNYGAAEVGPDLKVSIPVTRHLEGPVVLVFYGDKVVSRCAPDTSAVDPLDTINVAITFN